MTTNESEERNNTIRVKQCRQTNWKNFDLKTLGENMVYLETYHFPLNVP